MVLDKQSKPFHDPSIASTVDFSQIPTYLCFLLPPFRKDNLREAVVESLHEHAASVQRPLTPDETTALAHHSTKRHAFLLWGIIAGVVIGPNLVPSVPNATFKSFRNPKFWFRNLSLTAIYTLGVAAPLLTYAWLVPASGIINDPRLTDFNADLKKHQGPWAAMTSPFQARTRSAAKRNGGEDISGRGVAGKDDNRDEI